MGSCNSSLQFEFPLQRKNGDYEIVQGYRSQHSVHRLPCKGGMYVRNVVKSKNTNKFTKISISKLVLACYYFVVFNRESYYVNLDILLVPNLSLR